MSFHRWDGGGMGIFPKIGAGIPVGTGPRRDLLPMSAGKVQELPAGRSGRQVRVKPSPS